MRPPRTGLSIAAAVAAMVMSTVAAAQARRPDAGNIAADEEALRRRNAREQNEAIQTAVRRWTWAAMPLRSYDDGYDPNAVEPSRMARVTALAADASGGAIVGGVVRGPIQLGGTAVTKMEKKVGFIARVDRGGAFHMIRLEPESRWPEALAVDRTGRIVVAFQDGKLASVTPEGRTIWSRHLRPARAVALTADGDILAAGCAWGESEFATDPSETLLGDGYVARVSPAGDVRWMYRMELSRKQLFYRPDDRKAADCASGIAPGPGGDIYIAGTFSRDLAEGLPVEPNVPSGGSFLARFTADGRLRWSRPVGWGFGRVSLAAVPEGAVVVVAGYVAPRARPPLPDANLAAFDADGKPLWLLPWPGPAQPGAANPDVGDLRVVAHKAGDADFVLAGTYHAAVTAGGAPLPWTDGGVFLMSVDRRGSIKALRGLRTQRERMAEGHQISRLVLGPAAEALWVGGAMGALGQGAWVQATGW